MVQDRDHEEEEKEEEEEEFHDCEFHDFFSQYLYSTCTAELSGLQTVKESYWFFKKRN